MANPPNVYNSNRRLLLQAIPSGVDLDLHNDTIQPKHSIVEDSHQHGINGGRLREKSLFPVVWCLIDNKFIRHGLY
jgi:hypothetical protein